MSAMLVSAVVACHDERDVLEETHAALLAHAGAAWHGREILWVTIVWESGARPLGR